MKKLSLKNSDLLAAMEASGITLLHQRSENRVVNGDNSDKDVRLGREETTAVIQALWEKHKITLVIVDSEGKVVLRPST